MIFSQSGSCPRIRGAALREPFGRKQHLIDNAHDMAAGVTEVGLCNMSDEDAEVESPSRPTTLLASTHRMRNLLGIRSRSIDASYPCVYKPSECNAPSQCRRRAELYVVYHPGDSGSAVAQESPVGVRATDAMPTRFTESLDSGYDRLPSRRTFSDPGINSRRTPLKRYVVARSGSACPTGSETVRFAEYAQELLSCVERVNDAVENAVCDCQRTTSASRQADLLAAKTPAKLRSVAERAASIARQDPSALVDILSKDPDETALQVAFDAVSKASEHACTWLSYGPYKRGFAISLTTRRNGPQQLALKYVSRLLDASRACDEALFALDALRARLPRIARLVRFSSRTDVWQRQLSRSQSSVSSLQSTGFESEPDLNEELEKCKYSAEDVDDFLTEAAPMGLGVNHCEILACRDRDGSLFLTSNYRVAEDLLLRDATDLDRIDGDGDASHDDAQSPRERRSESDAPLDDDDEESEVPTHHSASATVSNNENDTSWRPQQHGPAVLVQTTIYKSIEDPRKMALDHGDQIWSVTIDDHDYYYCVMEDNSDLGLRHALWLVGVDDATCARLNIHFRHVE